MLRIPRLAILLIATAIVITTASRAQVQVGAAEDAGLRIEWRYTAEGDAEAYGLGTLEVQVMDAVARTPVRYQSGRIAAWMQRRRSPLAEAEVACTDKVKALASQGIGRRADIDLNAFRLVTLNTDGTLAVINPFVRLNNAKLESILELNGTPRTWLHIPDRMEAWVVLAQPARLLTVDLHTRRVTRAIDLPGNADAAWLAWEPGRQQLWVGLADRDGLGVVAPARAAGLHTLGGPPPLAVWADPEGRLPGVVTLHADGGVLLRDGEAPPRRWAVQGVPHQVRYSALAHRLVVGTAEGRLALIDPGAAAVQDVELGHSVQALALFDGDRRALALGGGRLTVVDLASAAITRTHATVPEADEIALTSGFAYAASVRAGRASLWRLSDLREGTGDAVEVTLGRPAPEEALAGPARTAAIPAGNGLLAANPIDGMVYQYAEGMMAPIGSYSNFHRAALGLLVMDLSLREVEPGRYRGTVRHTQGGMHEVVFSGVGPRFAACGQMVLAPTAVPVAQPGPSLRAELAGVSWQAAPPGQALQAIRVRMQSKDGDERSGIPDLVLLVFDRHSGWQTRAAMREVAAGEYEARVQVPGAAQYEVLTSSSTRNLSFLAGRVGSLRLGEAP